MFNIVNSILIICILSGIIIFLAYIKTNDLKEVYGEDFSRKYPNNLNKLVVIFLIILILLFFIVKRFDLWFYRVFMNLILISIAMMFLLKSKEYMKYIKLRKYAIKETLLSIIIIILILKYFLIEVSSRWF